MEALTPTNSIKAILPLSIAAHISPQLHARAELALQDIALVEEEHEVDGGEELVRAEGFPEEDRVLEAVHLRVLLERQVERERREEDDRLHVVKVRDPVLPLSAGTPGLAEAGWWGSAGRTQLREPPTS